MSKHTKKNRSKHSALKLEALEQRQLLATIVAGNGTEVDSNVTLSNGNTYDQILLTGSTITVGADTVNGVHQVTRVDFLDANGDLVRAEFSGAGTLKIDLAGFTAAAKPDGYLTDTEYVKGTAAFTIAGSDETTNFSVFSLGSANVHNQGLFDATHKGGDNWADVSSLVIQDNGSVLGNAFGRIGAGNAHFSAETGAVGIIAPNIQFQGDVIIGDIDAKGNATAVLKLGAYSSNKTVTVTGGDLNQTTGALDTENVSALVSSSGQTSFGAIVNTSIIHADAGVAADKITYKSSAEKVTINGQTATQAELDAYKTKFLNEVEITGGLKEGLTFAALMIGNVKVTGDLAGLITTDVDGDGNSDDNELSIGNVEITGNIVAKGAIEAATSIGNVTVGGGIDFEDVNDAKNAGAAAIISTLGRVNFSGKIGDIAFGEDVKLDNEDLALVIAAEKNAAGTADGIGKITIAGEFSGGAATVIQAKKGAIGNIAVTGDIDVGAISANAAIGTISGAEVTLGALTSTTKGIGAISSTDGDLTLAAITATEGLGAIQSDGDLTFGGAVSAKSIGAITSGGALTVTGTLASTGGDIGAIKATEGLLHINNTVTAVGGGIGAITASKGGLTIDGALSSEKGIGAITVSEGDLEINDTIEADEAIGAITVTEGDATIGAAVTGKSVGAISVTADEAAGGNLTVSAAVTATGGGIGAITLTGDDDAVALNLSGGGSFSATTSIGAVTVAGGSIVGKDGQVEFAANTIGDVTVVGHANDTVLLTNVIFKAGLTTAHDTDAKKKAAVESALIGDIVLDASAATGVAAIASSTAAATTDKNGTGFSSAGSIGDITLTTADNGKLLSAATSSLIFRAGSQLLGESEDTGVNDTATYNLGSDFNGGVSIGNVTISTQLNQPLSNGAAGTGLVIASGVNLADDGQFSTVAHDTTGDDVIEDAVTTPAKMGSGSTIGAVVLQDLSGASSFNGFVSATLNGDGNDVGATHHSVIVADKITSVSLATGAGTVLDLTSLNGLPLKGAIGTVGETDPVNADETANLFVVVL